MEQNSERGVKERKKEREKEKKGRKESSSRPVLLGSSQGRQEGPGTISHTRLHIETNTPPPPLSLPLSLSPSFFLSLSLSISLLPFCRCWARLCHFSPASAPHCILILFATE